MDTSRALMTKVLARKPGDRIPFAPAIYEHKGFLIGKTPSQVARNPDWLLAGLLKEFEVYRPDFLTVGIDVYNVEAEALGCKVLYFDDSPDVPGISERALRSPEDLDRLDLPDPLKDGRMPMYLEVAEEVHKQVGEEVMIRGAVTGPFSLASELIGAEDFIVMTMMDPEFTRKLMKFTARASCEFAKAFVARGLDPIIFDSRAMPPLCSPNYFNEVVAPIYNRYLIAPLKEAGAHHVPLIIGGNTTPIIDALIETGATQILCDFEGDIDLFKERTLNHELPVRFNVDPRLLHLGPIEKIQDFALNILHHCHDHPGFIFGTGVAAYDCPPEHIHAVRACLDMDYLNYEPRTKGLKIISSTPETLTADERPTYLEHLHPILREMAEAIEEGDEEDVPELVEEALDNGIEANDIVNDSMIPAMEIIGDRFSRNEIYVPEMLISARAMKAGLNIVRPILVNSGVQPIGDVLLGTVKGDIHDIGKNLVGMMLEGAAFKVTDLGVNVPVEQFIKVIQETGIRIIGLSALLTTTMNYMERVIQGLDKAGLRKQTKVLIGGAPINQKFCDRIGADYYAETAVDAVEVAKRSLAEIEAESDVPMESVA